MKGVVQWFTDQAGQVRLGFAGLRTNETYRWIVYKDPDGGDWKEMETAQLGAVKTPELYRCAVSLNGVSDLIALLTTDTGNFRDAEVAHAVGDPGADREALVANSPR